MPTIRLPGGRLSPEALSSLARAAREFAPDRPLHLTTRQDIELYDVPAERREALRRTLDDWGLAGAPTSGGALRNVTCCPGSGVTPNGICAAELASSIDEAALEIERITAAPRRFKIGISCCREACAKPWISDLGFVAGDDLKFTAIGAGSLGARPAMGIELYEGLSPGRCMALAVAALKLFNDHGQGENRFRARLRHVRERLGDAAFRLLLDDYFLRELEGPPRREPTVARISDGLPFVVRLKPPLGDLWPDEADKLAEVAAASGCLVRIGFEHDIFLFAAGDFALPGELARMTGNPVVVACPGAQRCPRGITHSRDLAQRMLETVSDAGLSVYIAGCPNGCTQPAVADVGLVGRTKTIGGKRVECYRLLAGGDKGTGKRLALELAEAVPAERVPAAVNWLTDEFKAHGDEASFADFVRAQEARLTEKIADFVR